MLEHNHYERAAAAWLRSAGLAFVPVHERQRASLGALEGSQESSTVKSPDFLLLGSGGSSFVVDVKGRRHPSGTAASYVPTAADHQPGPWYQQRDTRKKSGGTWECWVTLDDLDGLARWSTRLGPGWQGLFLFVYWLDDGLYIPEGPDLFQFDRRRYLFRCAELGEFRQAMRVRSRSWATVDLPARAARRVIKSLGQVDGLRPVSAAGLQGVGW